MTDRLFDIVDFPEVPIFREPPPGRGALVMDERLSHDYPPEWNRCIRCDGTGRIPDMRDDEWAAAARTLPCLDCLGMGSVKARVRLEAGHRCERCGHPYMPKGDAKMLGVQPTPHHWSPCDERCTHTGLIRYRFDGEEWLDWGLIATWGWVNVPGYSVSTRERLSGAQVEAEWRILTVHHLDGDKANLQWWNLAALCQRCHLHIQNKVVMERVYPHEHSTWFKPHAAGWYAFIYLGEHLSREQVAARMGELLALERT